MTTVVGGGNGRANDADNPLFMSLTGSNVEDGQAIPVRQVGMSEFDNGGMTVTASPIEVKAGNVRMANRRQMIIYPPNTGTIFWGGSDVTAADGANAGAPLAAGNSPVVIDFNPAVNVPIYAVNDGTDRSIRVVESK